MKKTRLITLLLTCTLALSCATNKSTDTGRRDLEAAPACCERYEQFDFQPLKLNGTESVTINIGSPVYTFDGGKSYFKAFRLPVQGRSYSIVVSSYFIDKDNLSRTPHIFSPVVMLLDANYRVTRTVDNGMVIPINAGNSMNHATMEIDITVNPRKADERFMVIYTTAALLNQVTELKVYKYSIIGRFEDHYPVQNAPIGHLDVNLTSTRYYYDQ